ncbi:MAG: tryptophan synthase subunit alpha [Pseudomonadota bacterium]
MSETAVAAEGAANRLTTRLAARMAEGRKSLVTFVTAGDPEIEATVPLLHALVAGGADVLELGIPFSDPEAEGPAIQEASERALANGTTLRGCFSMVQQFRQEDQSTPLLLMGYLNSVLRMGVETFAAEAAAAGVDGLIMVNLPPEEAADVQPVLKAAGIELVFLVAPTTTPERRRQIIAHSGGFVYYVSLKGTTGAGHFNPERVAAEVATVKGESRLPVMVGFGIRDGASAAAIARSADGVVVGSALVQTQADTAQPVAERRAAAQALTAEIRSALDALPPQPLA